MFNLIGGWVRLLAFACFALIVGEAKRYDCGYKVVV
jgi:hypothetical protein